MKSVLIIGWAVFSLQVFADAGTETRVTQVPAESMTSQGSSDQSGSAMAQQMMGAGMNAAMGARLSSICGTPGGQWACPMAVMSFAQAAMMMMSAGQSGNTMDYATSGFEYDPSSLKVQAPGFEEYNVGTTPKELKAFISEGASQLSAGQGYSFDPATSTMTTPKGTFVVDDATGASAGALVKAAGGSADDMKLAESTAIGLADQMGKAFGGNGLDSKASVSGMGFNSHGGGKGSGSRHGSQGGASESLSDYFSSLNRKPSSKEKTRMIAGKSKLLGKDSIGVSVDNIFTMVHRRYQAQRKANGFLEPIITGSTKKK